MQKKIFFFVEEGNIAADSYLPLIFDANIFLFAFISDFVKQQPGIGLVKFSQFLLIPKQYHYSFESFSLFFVFHFWLDESIADEWFYSLIQGFIFDGDNTSE